MNVNLTFLSRKKTCLFTAGLPQLRIPVDVFFSTASQRSTLLDFIRNKTDCSSRNSFRPLCVPVLRPETVNLHLVDQQVLEIVTTGPNILNSQLLFFYLLFR